MHQMTLEALRLHQAVVPKVRSETQVLLGDEHVNVYKVLFMHENKCL